MIIGLSGKKRAGKDTVASVLVEEFGAVRVGFADALKASMLEVDPYVIANGFFTRLSELVSAVGWEQAKESPEVRRLLQQYGQGVRSLDAQFWIDVALRQALRAADNGRHVIIPDVRYMNEVVALAKVGGRIIRVERPGLESADDHSSETELDGYPFAYRIVNDRTVCDVEYASRSLARNLGL